jgi:hypothetical protein
MTKPTSERERRRLPALSEGAPGRPERPRYREQYGVIVVCPDEKAQHALYEALATLALCKLRVVTT